MLAARIKGIKAATNNGCYPVFLVVVTLQNTTSPSLATAGRPKEAGARPVYAVLIGIDQYLPNSLCEPLHGAVADAAAMEAFLLARGVPAANLVKLTASRGRGEGPAEPEEERPTYAAMTGAIRRLGRAAAEAGGELLIHYSGHGCRTPTLIPSTKGVGGLDEGLVPYDVAHAGTRILRDVELSYLLAELSEQGVATVLILDACHSGGILRSDDVVRSRGARCVDPVARPLDSAFAPLSVLEASWRRAHQRAFKGLVERGAAPLAGRLGPLASLIAACRDREAAYEFPFDGEIRGALTHALLAALGEGDSVPGWERLHRRVASSIRRLGLRQTPVFEGEPSGTLLGMLRRGAGQALRVVECDHGRRRVLLDAGRALGLGPGARLEILPGAGDGPDRCALPVELEECDAGTSWARLCEGDVATIGSGDRAFLIDPGPGRRCRVQVVPAAASPSAERLEPPPPAASAPAPPRLRDGRPLGHRDVSPRQRLQAVECALDARAGGFLERVAYGQPAGGAAPDFRVTLRGGAYEVLQLDGRPIPHLPPLPAASPVAADLLVDRLVHLARFFKVRELENGDRRSPLHGSLTAELARLPMGFVLGDDLEPEPCTEAPPRFAAGETVCLSVANHSRQALHLYVLDLEPDWAVRLLHPRSGLETLPAGQEVRLPFALSLPPGIRHGFETFKVVATTRPTNVRWLELPAIDQSSSADRTFRWLPADPLEEFFAAALREARPSRSASARGASRVWITDQVDFQLVEAGC